MPAGDSASSGGQASGAGPRQPAGRSHVPSLSQSAQAARQNSMQVTLGAYNPHRSSFLDLHTCPALVHCWHWRIGYSVDVDPVGVAVLVVHNAWHGREPAEPTAESLWARQIYHALWYRYLSLFVLLGYLSLTAFEVPARAEYNPSLQVAEGLCLLMFAADLRLQWLYYGQDIFFKKLWSVAKAVLIPLFFVSLALHAGSGGTVVHFARPLRPVFLIERMRGVRRVAANMMKAIPKMLYVGFLMWMNIAFFGVVFFVFLRGVEGVPPNIPGSSRVCPPRPIPPPRTCSTYNSICRDYFATLDNSIYQLFILSTTANFPDVMLPAYECNPLWAWLFIIFIVIAIYLLFNLTLAVAFTAFSSVTESKVLDQMDKQLAGFGMAFGALLKHQRRAHLAAQAAAAASRAKEASVEGRLGEAAEATAEATMFSRRASVSQQAQAAQIPQQQRSCLTRAIWVQFYTRLKRSADGYIAGVLFDALDSEGTGLADEVMFQRLMVYFARIHVRRHGIIQAISPTDSHATTGSLPPQSSSATSLTGPAATPPPAPSQGSPTQPARAGLAATQDWGSASGPRQRPALSSQGQHRSFRHGVASPPSEPTTTACCSCQGVANAALRAVGTYVGSGVPIATPRASKAPLCSRNWAAYMLFNAWATVFFDGMVLLNGVIIVAQLQLSDAHAKSAEGFVLAAESIQLVTLSVFLGEVVAKALVLGPLHYFRMSAYHRSDLLLALLSVMALSLQAETTAEGSGQLASAITMVRMVRMLRGARVLPGFTVTMASFMDAIPLLAQFVVVYAAMLYSFAVIGMELYHDLLSRSDANVAASAYGRLQYWALNFDSISNAMTTLFHTSVVNNAPVVFEGLEAATGSKWPRVFFIMYYTVTVLLVLNVVVAFFIESFSVQRERRETVAQLVAEGAMAPDTSPSGTRARNASSPWEHLIVVPELGTTATLLPNGSLDMGSALSKRDMQGVTFHDLKSKPILRPSYEWRLVIEASGLDTSQYTLWKRLHADDIYTTLYMSQLRESFPQVFSDEGIGRHRSVRQAGDQPAHRPSVVSRRSSM